jgi:hypothetical protein
MNIKAIVTTVMLSALLMCMSSLQGSYPSIGAHRRDTLSEQLSNICSILWHNKADRMFKMPFEPDCELSAAIIAFFLPQCPGPHGTESVSLLSVPNPEYF